MDRPRPMDHEMDDAVIRLAGVAGRLDAVLTSKRSLYFHIPRPGFGSTTYCGRVVHFPTPDHAHIRRCADATPDTFCQSCLRKRKAGVR